MCISLLGQGFIANAVLERAGYIYHVINIDMLRIYIFIYVICVVVLGINFPFMGERKVKRKYMSRASKITMGVLVFSYIVAVLIIKLNIPKTEPMSINISKEELDKVVLENSESLIIDNYDYLKGITFESYMELDNESKLHELKRVAAVESINLGIKPPSIIIGPTSEYVRGATNLNGDLITISESLLGDEWCTLETLLHELHHVYQIQCIAEGLTDSNLLYAREIRKWKEADEALIGYEDMGEKYQEYYTSAPEVSARAYAKERMEQYSDIFGIK